ncbi:efflux RND transporter periplasmic adaptor subunit [Yoonia litorea]|uniref:RND family efflux transporter, MFP subunit n=1 Tax=Yoonia litorea TaxID=1123755 RepID=A0A1I6MM47_9RHOB|nr:efflux RND transporter periplasmic adaptor subunit [Yoonia litorea]SFS16806.1 RND family efflux transporter, MFP subunit [Yoonia litorea]
MRIHSVIAGILLAVALPSLAFAQGRPAGVQTKVIEMEEMTETVSVFGQIVAVRQSAVATRVSGVIASVPIQIGSTVAAGDTLAQMDTSRLQIELASAQAQLEIAIAGLEVAQAVSDRATKAFERADELAASASISSAALEERASAVAEAQGGLAQAEARIAAAQNAISLAEYNLSNATIRAPFDGVVLDIFAQPGQFAATGSQITTLLDISNVEVEANIPARYVASLSPDRTVAGATGGGATFTTTLRAVLPTEFSETRTRPVRFAVDTFDPSFAIGQPVTLDVPIGDAREVLAVPKDALVQARGGWTAYVNDGGKASPRTVTVGAPIGDNFEVLSGLAPGDEVVVRGNERLRPGQDIAPMGAGGPPGGRPGGGPPAAASAPEGGGGPDDEASTEEG